VLLVSGRDSLTAREQVLYRLPLADGRPTELVRSERLRGELLSSDGSWVAYLITFDPDPGKNGLWLVSTDGVQQRRLEPDLFGAYQWRDARRLLVIPLKPQADSQELWEVNADTGETRRLTDPQVTPFMIANADAAVSPDGRYLAFVASQDRNVWLLTLP